LYQLNANNWSPERYRLEIWEGERWNWSVGNISGKGQHPDPGDIVVFSMLHPSQLILVFMAGL
jgi:hypothetical protein